MLEAYITFQQSMYRLWSEVQFKYIRLVHGYRTNRCKQNFESRSLRPAGLAGIDRKHGRNLCLAIHLFHILKIMLSNRVFAQNPGFCKQISLLNELIAQSEITLCNRCSGC